MLDNRRVDIGNLVEITEARTKSNGKTVIPPAVPAAAPKAKGIAILVIGLRLSLEGFDPTAAETKSLMSSPSCVDSVMPEIKPAVLKT